MKVKVLFWGRLTDITGTNVCDIENIDDLHELKDSLIKTYPGLSDQHYMMAVNQEVSNGNTALEDGDEVAFMPPYAGG